MSLSSRRIIDSLKLEKVSKIESNLPPNIRVSITIKNHSTVTCSQFSNTSRDGDSNTSLGNFTYIHSMYDMITTRDRKNCHLKMPLTLPAVYPQFDIAQFQS